MSRYKSDTWTSVCRTLLPQQITGVVHMLLRACGDFPPSKIQLQDREKYEKSLVCKRCQFFNGIDGNTSGE
jgi:hypothetical protein